MRTLTELRKVTGTTGSTRAVNQFQAAGISMYTPVFNQETARKDTFEMNNTNSNSSFYFFAQVNNFTIKINSNPGREYNSSSHLVWGTQLYFQTFLLSGFLGDPEFYATLSHPVFFIIIIIFTVRSGIGSLPQS